MNVIQIEFDDHIILLEESCNMCKGDGKVPEYTKWDSYDNFGKPISGHSTDVCASCEGNGLQLSLDGEKILSLVTKYYGSASFNHNHLDLMRF